MVMHACSPSTLRAGTEGSGVQVQPELYSKALDQQTNKPESVCVGGS
jgi:hypothetical protein